MIAQREEIDRQVPCQVPSEIADGPTWREVILAGLVAVALGFAIIPLVMPW